MATKETTASVLKLQGTGASGGRLCQVLPSSILDALATYEIQLSVWSETTNVAVVEIFDGDSCTADPASKRVLQLNATQAGAWSTVSHRFQASAEAVISVALVAGTGTSLWMSGVDVYPVSDLPIPLTLSGFNGVNGLNEIHIFYVDACTQTFDLLSRFGRTFPDNFKTSTIAYSIYTTVEQYRINVWRGTATHELWKPIGPSWQLNTYTHDWSQFWAAHSVDIADTRCNRSLAKPEEYTFYVDGGYSNNERAETLSRLGYREVLHSDFEGIDVLIRMWPRSIDWSKIYTDYRIIVNNVPGIEVLDRKSDMQQHLEHFDRHCKINCLNLEDFFLPTFDIASQSGCRSWVQSSIALNPETGEQERSVWLHKPPVAYGGIGLVLVNSATMNVEAAEQCATVAAKLQPATVDQSSESSAAKIDLHGLPVPDVSPIVLQEYMTRVMKFRGCKFSIRHYVLILSVNPPVMLSHPGRITVCAEKYNDTDIEPGQLFGPEAGLRQYRHVSHSRGHPQYQAFMDECKRTGECTSPGFYSFDTWAAEHGTEIVSQVLARAKAIESFVFRSVLDYLGQWAEHPGTFQFMAVDFGIEPNGRLVLHEFNVAPGTGIKYPIYETLFRMVHEVHTLRLSGKSIIRSGARSDANNQENATKFEILSPWEPVCIGSGLARRHNGTALHSCDLFDASKKTQNKGPVKNQDF